MDAVSKIHQFNRFGSRLGLERMTVLLDKLGNPHLDLDVIHVAGTNGKGSTSKFLEEGLAACGYKVGLYTSPFIEKFNERIRLGGSDISDKDLQNLTDEALAAVDEMLAEGHESPTEFEVVTAIAFLYFKQKAADITILEVGLGGSGDSTNVVPEPLACVITSIGYDHMDRLGNTLEEIAGEKAGIIKEGVPVISNVSQRAAAQVIARKAYEKNCKFYDVSKIKLSIEEPITFGMIGGASNQTDSPELTQVVSMNIYGTDYSGVEISMLGEHQGENLKTALATIEVLRKDRKIKVERSKLYEGLKKAIQPGRFEIIDMARSKQSYPAGTDAANFDSVPTSGVPTIIIDGAHNEPGAEALKKTVKKYFDDKRILLVTGMLADKQVDGILKHFTEITKDIIITEPDNPRKLQLSELAIILTNMGVVPINAEVSSDNEVSGFRAKTPAESVELALSMGGDYDVILFAGSLYLIGEIRGLLQKG